jgi:glycosyltransferase involved in cell wall biosynthesis
MDMNFVFVSLQPINTDRDSTSTCLAKQLSKNHKVLYVNPPIDRRTLLSKSKDPFTKAHIDNIKSKKKKLTQLRENLWMLHPSTIIESINWIPSTFIFKKLNWINNVRFAKDIKEALIELEFETFVLINDKDIFRSFYLKELLHPEKYIYLDRDNTVAMDYWKRHGTKLEPVLMQKSNAVVCNSNDFAKRAKQYNPNSFYIGNGFDTDQYNYNILLPEPEDLKNISHPRIGYVGALLSLRLDLKLFIEMAKNKPGWSFVLIGWEDEAFQKSELHSLANVYFLGRKSTKEIPAYLEHVDVCINPQTVNDITTGNFPLKIVEYLAMAKPVVATATNTMKEVFSQHSYLADGCTSFIYQTEIALQENSDELRMKRIHFVRQFSWENITKVLMKYI